MTLHLTAAFSLPPGLAGLFAARAPPSCLSLRMNHGIQSDRSPAGTSSPFADSSRLGIAPQLFDGQDFVRGEEKENQKKQTCAAPDLPFPVETMPEGFEWNGRRVSAETVSGSPHIVLLRSLLSPQERAHLKQLAEEQGLARALVHQVGEHALSPSSFRTNSQAWIGLGHDEVVSGIEGRIARLTGTSPAQGEPLQVLRYEPGQHFATHFDFFDPLTDPPAKFKAGGNRLASLVMCLEEAEEGGETEFDQLGLRLKLQAGDGVLWRNLLPNCDGADPRSLDRRTSHAGLPVVRGDKWVATKWIHERACDWMRPDEPPPPPPHFAAYQARRAAGMDKDLAWKLATLDVHGT